MPKPEICQSFSKIGKFLLKKGDKCPSKIVIYNKGIILMLESRPIHIYANGKYYTKRGEEL
jgi:hypothetical protein